MARIIFTTSELLNKWIEEHEDVVKIRSIDVLPKDESGIAILVEYKRLVEKNG